LELKGRRGCRSRSSWPAGGIVRALLGMLGLGGGKGHRLSRRRPA
jgi:MYXO-CTERM domain-containing protein